MKFIYFFIFVLSEMLMSKAVDAIVPTTPGKEVYLGYIFQVIFEPLFFLLIPFIFKSPAFNLGQSLAVEAFARALRQVLTLNSGCCFTHPI